MDEIYASLVYDGAPRLRVPVCVSRALLVAIAKSRDWDAVNPGIPDCNS